MWHLHTPDVINVNYILCIICQDIVLAGGMESLSNVPLIIRRQVPYLKDIPLLDCLVHDGYLDPILKIFMGDCADHLNKKMGISRQEQDEFALRSYDRSAAAWRDGRMTSSVVPVTVKHKGGKLLVGGRADGSLCTPIKLFII